MLEETSLLYSFRSVRACDSVPCGVRSARPVRIYLIAPKEPGPLLRRVVVQVGTKPTLNLGDAHGFPFVIVDDLVPFDLSQTEIARLRMGEV